MMLVNGERTNGIIDFLLYLLILFGSGVMISVYSQMGFRLLDTELYGQRCISETRLADRSACFNRTGFT